MSELKLLVVDDEPGIRSGVERVLRNFTVTYPFLDDDFSYNIIEAETGEIALEIIEKSGVDIVLLDNKLPGMDGIEVLEHIKNKDLDLAVMMITSYASLELAVKATNNGAFNFVPKPFTPQELKAAVESITKNLYLRRMTRKMKEEGKQIRFQFLSVLSHELKSPINAVEGYLKIMKEKQAGDNIEDYMEMIDRSIERIKGMRNLILDLLDLTRMESGKKSRDIRPVDVADIARSVVDAVEVLAIQRNIKVNLESEESIFVNADKNEMEIIINNLVSNAVKYNKENGKVFLTLSKKDGELIIKVEDSGIGMTPEETALLFQDFVRIKNTKTKFVTGSGLGLSIAKKMTELYGGTIGVESTPDVGSTFTVKMPAK
jgi:two-component system sensor histidine kinase/response regulator